MSDYVVQPSAQASGAIRVPGDKSISHRSLMLGSIAEGVSEVSGFLESEDCLATMKAMRALGVRIDQMGPQAIRVHGVGLRGLKPAAHALDMGNSGTAMRLMTGLLAGQPFASELIGDSSLMKRPMERAATPLRSMGAQIETLGGKPPVKITPSSGLQGIRYELPVASAQVKWPCCSPGCTQVERPRSSSPPSRAITPSGCCSASGARSMPRTGTSN
jgi:3-phosphoshikimate 1-carboxyvinyltransferase